MNTDRRIEYPDNDEIEKSISLIIDQGLGQRKKEPSGMTEAYRTIGFRNLFFGLWSVLALSALCGTVFYVSEWAAVQDQTKYLEAYLYCAAPVLILVYSVLSKLKDQWDHMFELKNIRKYRTGTLSCMQIAAASVFSAALTVLMSSLLGESSASAMHNMRISLMSLSFFSTGMLLCESIRSVHRIWVMPMIWILCIIISLLMPEKTCTLIGFAADGLAYIAVPLMIGISYVYMKHELNRDRRGENYAFN